MTSPLANVMRGHKHHAEDSECLYKAVVRSLEKLKSPVKKELVSLIILKIRKRSSIYIKGKFYAFFFLHQSVGEYQCMLTKSFRNTDVKSTLFAKEFKIMGGSGVRNVPLQSSCISSS